MKDAGLNQAGLLALYNRVAEAEDAIPRLRRFVLDLAMRGKMVPQEAGDEPASVLLERIENIRRKRVAAGELKKPKEMPPIAPEDCPSSIPATWAWTMADTLWDFENGDRSSNYPSRDQLVETGIPFINAGHLESGRVSLVGMNFITLEKFKSLSGGKLRQGDQLYCLRGSLGKHAVFDLQTDAAIASSLVILRPVLTACVPYLTCFLDSDLAQVQLRRFDNGSAQPNLSSANLRRYTVPLPPLAEQNRIVAKVKELMFLLDRLEAARAAREETRTRLTASTLGRLTEAEKDTPIAARFALQTLPALTTREDRIKTLRQTILNLAVRGKLVEQDAGDEPASVLLERIERITGKAAVTQVDEHPFALPRGWAWSDIGGICSKTGSGSTPRGGKEVYTAEGVPFLRSQNVYDHGLVLNDVAYIAPGVHEKMSGTRVRPADLLLNITGGSMGRCCRVPNAFTEANVSQHVAIIRCAIPEMADFLHALVRSPYFQRFIFDEQTGAGRGGLPKNRMDRILVALPPLAEQHRIVAKVEELLSLCDRLAAALREAATTRARLLDATLREALAGANVQDIAQ